MPIIITVLAAVIAFEFASVQNDYNNQLSAQQHTYDTALASDQQQETDLVNYLSSMSTLLANSDLRSATALDGPDLRSLARVQTLNLLSEFRDTGVNGLNNAGVRKRRVMRFLHDANLINRGTSALQVPVVSLDGADFSQASLSDLDLGGADLAGVNLRGADLRGADLMGATLSQADLSGTLLVGAMLDYTQLDRSDLRCLDKQHCTNLSNADLSGADFAFAKLDGATFLHTNVSGTNVSNATPGAYLTQVMGDSKKTFTTIWGVVAEHDMLKISYRNGGRIALYGIIDLNTGNLQLIYGPFGHPGASVILFPALWSYTSCPGDYCQYARVTGGSYTPLLLNANSAVPAALQYDRQLSFTIVGTVVGLEVTDTIILFAPGANSMTAKVSAAVTNTAPITLDQNFRGTTNPLQQEAFKPVVATALYDSSSIWTAQKAVFGKQPPLQLAYDAIRPPPVQQTSIELMGGISSSVINAPTISVALDSLSASGKNLMSRVSATLQVQKSSGDNVNMWVGIDAPNAKDDSWSYPNQWSYTVVALAPY
jgi:uncharacterized protein YjbI with pentapeptide repeats